MTGGDIAKWLLVTLWESASSKKNECTCSSIVVGLEMDLVPMSHANLESSCLFLC